MYLCAYLPAAPLRSFGEARPAGRFQSSVKIRSAATGHCERSEAELISDISMRIWSEASIAESP